MQFSVPTNTTELRILSGQQTKREVSQKNLLEIYLPLELFLQEYGFDGKECLLRIICETAQVPFQHDKMELLEEIAHAILTPSDDLYTEDEWCGNKQRSHAAENIEYLAAECLGRSDGDCISAYPSCLQSPLEFISQTFFHLDYN
ncbi:hypothetical protein L9F63_015373 [Diploptera punctata]|uniref:Uncharacterized protein n=1 Tax=Diploptera punctata TaxID=6984 RepID=A0AAD8EK62_DIPPU|nr:hypothetical protein L9F63_015373 [Diploptera punctata]